MKAKAKSRSGNQLRIIAGQWRGRKLNFADGEGLRPTMDRVRETLFNWLQHDIAGARCLDLFSGSGALGLEALSRHAGEVLMIDKNPQAIAMIADNLKLLKVGNAQLLHMDAVEYLQQQADKHTDKPFDIVFLDPPFNKNLLPVCCDLLDKSQCLSPQALIYIEVEKNTPLPALPEHWQPVKEKRAGQLAYYLLSVNKRMDTNQQVICSF